jgi:hypothetical protein
MLGLVATAIITGISLLGRRSKRSAPLPAPVQEQETPSTPPQHVSWVENSPKRVVRGSLSKDRPTPPPEILMALVHYPSTPEQLLRAVQSEKLTLLRYNLRRLRGESG